MQINTKKKISKTSKHIHKRTNILQDNLQQPKGYIPTKYIHKIHDFANS